MKRNILGCFVHVQDAGHDGPLLPQMYSQALGMPETLGLQTELVQLMSELYVLLVHPVAAVKVQAERK